MRCSQYHGKSDNQFSYGLSLHRTDVSREKSPPCDQLFKKPGHCFDKRTKLIITEKFTN